MLPAEMVCPGLGAGVIEGLKALREGIEASDVGSFESIAMDASEGEVVEGGVAAVLTGDDVVDLEGGGVEIGGKAAVFATMGGAIGYALGNCHCRFSATGMLLGGRGRETAPGFGLHERKEVGDVDEAIEFCAFLRGE